VWADLKRFVRKHLCSTVDEVIEVVKEFNQSITPAYCQAHILKIKEVINIVIEKNGGWSNF
jgi:hypothetical protein